MANAHARLIDALGGGTKVGAELTKHGHKIDRATVYKWKINGVPWRWRQAVADIATRKDVAVPSGFLPPAAAAE